MRTFAYYPESVVHVFIVYGCVVNPFVLVTAYLFTCVSRCLYLCLLCACPPCVQVSHVCSLKCLYMCPTVCSYVYMCDCVSTCVSTLCPSVCMYAHPCVCVCPPVCSCVYMCVHPVSKCLHVFPHVCASTCVCLQHVHKGPHVCDRMQ